MCTVFSFSSRDSHREITVALALTVVPTMFSWYGDVTSDSYIGNDDRIFFNVYAVCQNHDGENVNLKMIRVTKKVDNPPPSKEAS